MSLRPVPARWFEVIVDRDDCGPAVETLAATSQVEFESRGEGNARQQLAAFREPLDGYRLLRSAYAAYWPEPIFDKKDSSMAADLAAKDAIARLHAWQRAAQPHLEALRAVEGEREDLLTWRQILEALSGSALDLAGLGQSGPFFSAVCFLLPNTADPSSFAGLLSVSVPVGEQRCIVALVPQEESAQWRRQSEALDGRYLRTPDWFGPGLEGTLAALGERLRRQASRAEQARQELARLVERHAVARALGQLQRLEWFVSHADNLSMTENFCWITGWTSAAKEGPLNQVLENAGIQALVHFQEAPEGMSCPSLLRNPGWARPFEIFTRALGVPGREEADPSMWVALLVPLMFGYMFGDVGQGLILLVTGFYLQRRWPLARLLVIGGASSVVFGFLFGSIFGREDLIPAVWTEPLASPLLVMGVPLAAGAVILTLGLLLNSAQSCWRGGEGLRWLGDVGQLVVYWGVIVAFFEPSVLWVLLAGIVVCMVRRFWLSRSFSAVLRSLGQLVENTLQLLMNTLSFVRVGAFGLAHAGLASAVVALADAVASPISAFVIMALGNLLIIALEGLVVSIQTTRLILFEFFVRFFQGQGRRFQPASLPPSMPRGQQHERKD